MLNREHLPTETIALKTDSSVVRNTIVTIVFFSTLLMNVCHYKNTSTRRATFPLLFKFDRFGQFFPKIAQIR